MKLIDNLSLNLKYYRKVYKLSQEKFGEILGTTLSYLNQIENKKVDVRLSTIDKFANNINKFDNKINIKSEDLIKYDKKHITNYTRIDEKKKWDNYSKLIWTPFLGQNRNEVFIWENYHLKIK